MSAVNQPPYSSPPSYDDAVGGRQYGYPEPMKPPYPVQPPHPVPQSYSGVQPPYPVQQSYSGVQPPYPVQQPIFPPEHTITVYPSDTSCGPDRPPPRQYPIVVTQEVMYRQRPPKWVRCFVIVFTIVFFISFFTVFFAILRNMP